MSRPSPMLVDLTDRDLSAIAAAFREIALGTCTQRPRVAEWARGIVVDVLLEKDARDFERSWGQRPASPYRRDDRPL